ncbi:MAG: helix-turn-helix domain-containing protein [Promethearchaeota archaeon]|jgi:putative transcriptional regulator
MSSTIIQKIETLLRRANYETFYLDSFLSKKSKFCFDLLVKKDDSIFSVKVFPNIDNLNPTIIRDIKSLSSILRSKPLLIGIRNRYQKLEDGTIYIREGLPFITLNTLEIILADNIFPYVLARRGGGVVFIDGNLMKKIRETHSITRKELSEKLGVTKRTISSYENESMRPSEEMAEKIVSVLEDSKIFKNINIFKWNIKFDVHEVETSEEKELSDFESHVQSIIKDLGISSYWYKKGSIPFKVSMFSSIDQIQNDRFYPLFSTISEEQDEIKAMNFNCLKVFNELFHKTSLCIIDNNVRIPEAIRKEDIHVVKVKKLEQVDGEEEFIELIQES